MNSMWIRVCFDWPTAAGSFEHSLVRSFDMKRGTCQDRIEKR